MSERRRRTGRRRRKKGLGPVFAVFLIMAIIVGGAALFLKLGTSPPEPNSEESVAVSIPVGSGTQTIGTILEDKGIIKSAFVFRIESKFKGMDGVYKAGEYLLSPSMAMGEVIDSLAGGENRNVKRFTIPEGYTVEQTIESILAKNLGTEEGLKAEATTGDYAYWFLRDVPDNTKYALEGYLYPQTYDVSPEASDHELLNTMLNHFGTLFTEDMAAQAADMGYDINEILTIASMIERETRVDEEKGRIASVIYNRLEKGMRLQIDATVQYALGKPKAALSTKDTEINSPYNTYKIEGLPPGPICSPAISSIQAALEPENTKYLFYVLGTDGTGSHNFSEDYDKFERDKAAYKNYIKAQ